jgi:hypothetical protein
MSDTAAGGLLDDYIDDSELARKLKVTTRTTRRYRNEPDGLPYLTIGGRIYYRIPSVMDWLAARERRPNPRRAA